MDALRQEESERDRLVREAHKAKSKKKTVTIEAIEKQVAKMVSSRRDSIMNETPFQSIK